MKRWFLLIALLAAGCRSPQMPATVTPEATMSADTSTPAKDTPVPPDEGTPTATATHPPFTTTPAKDTPVPPDEGTPTATATHVVDMQPIPIIRGDEFRIVQPGDTIWDWACDTYGVCEYYVDICAANPALDPERGGDCSIIHAAPPDPAHTYYIPPIEFLPEDQ